ncbi:MULTISPECIES: ABC transporter substrate-binding protein [unclassified Streptomyces]|uniref:ABC transporter substrate-binding protein n=1 Tax=unclassified Streptomyces TaxID=2593676 RepID=UPI002DD87632|nr:MULTISPECIES: ABC transporter substrate-binding protein [unclassified Streptomyces]WSA92222.1 ABC transporter substrate-binding protein [Streptomyces sp. NBC_01795]WSS15125.1 ABC transporter substrate-binding protein [Streptomyces sp. NBC_01186]WSS43968.1 ABC transporter substrate-binding protein [Streptomyces sp. NBC_01187]
MRTKRTSRRRLAAVSALAIGTLLATSACGGGDSDSDSAGAGFNAGINKVAKASDKKGGTIKYVGVQDADSWDTTRMYYAFAFDFARYYSRQLVSYDGAPGKKGINLKPDLAKAKAKISDDGKTYEYELKDGLKWEDGKPITAEDVKYGIERQWAQKVLSGGPTYLKDILDPDGKYKGPYEGGDFKGIETKGNKITFHLAERNGDFEQMLAMPTNSPVRKDKDAKSKYALKPFSSGPYKFQSYTPNKNLTLVRNPNWSKKNDDLRKALPDKVQVTLLTNPDERDKRLINGDADLDLNQRGMDSQGRTTALKKHKGNVDNSQSGFISYVAFPQSIKPFDNIHCRKAAIYGTDHKSVQTARGGPMAGGGLAINMLPPVVPGHDKSDDQYGIAKGKPDVTKAKAELKKCGKPKGFKTTMAVRNTDKADVKSSEAIQASLKKVGIDVEIDQFDGAQGSSIVGNQDKVKQKNYGMVMYGWGPDFPSGQGYGVELWHSKKIRDNGNNNYALIDEKKVDEGMDGAIAELDPDKAADKYAAVNKEVMKGGYYLPLTYLKVIQWRSSRLTNVYATDAYSGWYDFVNIGVK